MGFTDYPRFQNEHLQQENQDNKMKEKSLNNVKHVTFSNAVLYDKGGAFPLSENPSSSSSPLASTDGEVAWRSAVLNRPAWTARGTNGALLSAVVATASITKYRYGYGSAPGSDTTGVSDDAVSVKASSPTSKFPAKGPFEKWVDIVDGNDATGQGEPQGSSQPNRQQQQQQQQEK